MSNPNPFITNPDRANRFRSKTNLLLLKGLFFELSDSKDTVIYTLKDEDFRDYKSLKKLYLECNDPTEYKFAILHLDGLEHFEQLCQCTWFKPYIAQWRHELDLKLKSESLAKVIEEAASDSKQRFAANKYLIEKGWAEPDKKGRPTKAQISKEAQRIAEENQRIDNDFSRIMGTA